MKRLIFILLILLAIQSCNDDDIICGGVCSYDSIPGVAFIRQVVPDTLFQNICDNVVFVYFDFIPDSASALENYKFPNWPDTDRRLLVADGKNPPASWIEALGLTEGTSHPCIRLEENQGTCTPVLHILPDIDYTTWQEYCNNPDSQ